MSLITKLKRYPESFLDDELWNDVASAMIEDAKVSAGHTVPVAEKAAEYQIYGEEYIETGARNQMNTAMKLWVVATGALMPDAHQGYGLPIGGVLATRNTVIPYGVGVDIRCRLALSAFTPRLARVADDGSW